ncbi:MAG: ATP-binding protein, partial [Candidatus Electrothrix sp. AUS1_2]|nr:ATP-binding protein [Candidatus Electrothrix sp. AUS1_2]
MIDFSKIQGFQSGQRHSFEELVCQLARREEYPADAEFRRVEGAGGDGGVEAYWKKADGKKIAYQAKYFLRTGDIAWGQIDESVAQALITHEELEEYVVALPCNLTDRSGNKGQGKTGWEHWQTHVEKWQKEAAKHGNSILRFTVWPQSELLTRLTKPTTEGLRQYWFGEVEFSQGWFQKHVQEGIASLDERFHPEDHVDVRIQKLFAVIARHPSCVEELKSKLASIAENALSTNQFSGLPQQPDPALLANLSKAQQQLLSVQEEFALPPHQDWDIDRWIPFADELISLLDNLLDWCWEYARKLKRDSTENNEVYRQRSELSSLKDAVEEFRSFCASEFMQAEQGRLAFIEGRAGTGKSHLFGKEASRVADEGGAVILALGQRMNNEEPWSQFAKFFHLPNKNADVLLGALDAAGEARGERALLLIDAINEGPGSRYWQNHILSFVELVQKYKNIACIISCRSEYFPIAIPDSLAEKTPTFSIRGFETYEEQVNAAKVFLDRRGIARPSTPWLAPEFINPLFLRSVCVSLERDGKSEFPTGLHGTRHILSYYLDSVGKNIKAAEGSLASLPAAVKTSVVQLASTMVSHRKDYLTMSAAEQVIGKYFPQTAPHSESSWLLVLLSNGLIRR